MTLEGKTSCYYGREYDGEVIITHSDGKKETYKSARRHVTFRDDGPIVLYRYDSGVTTKIPAHLGVSLEDR